MEQGHVTNQPTSLPTLYNQLRPTDWTSFTYLTYLTQNVGSSSIKKCNTGPEAKRIAKKACPFPILVRSKFLKAAFSMWPIEMSVASMARRHDDGVA